MIEVLLQKRDDDGENTGELDTATEQDIAFLFSLQRSNLGLFCLKSI